MSKKMNSGFMLLEALIALLIFSLGILGLIALQASSSKLTADARYRTEAALYADELIARMRLADKVSLAANFSTGGPDLTAWKTARLAAAGTGLPDATVRATVTPDVAGGTGTFIANITIEWQGPGTIAAANASNLAAIRATERGRYVTTAFIE